MTIKLAAMVLLVFTPMLVRADDDNDPHPCTFTGHTTTGIVAGKCETQQQLLPGYHARWTLTLQFNGDKSIGVAQLKPDQFADMVRTQSTEIGSDIIVLSLWGDLQLLATEKEYVELIKEAAPIYETRPNLITVTQVNDDPFTLQLLFEEPDSYLDLVTRQPSAGWWSLYLKSYYRLGTNRSDGFSSSDGGGASPAAKRTANRPPKN